jgi:hypothetical protein
VSGLVKGLFEGRCTYRSVDTTVDVPPQFVSSFQKLSTPSGWDAYYKVNRHLQTLEPRHFNVGMYSSLLSF